MAPAKRPASPTEAKAKHSEFEIYRSNPIEDRSSTFVGLYSSSPSLLPRTLQRDSEIASASHKILAWRRPSAQRSINPGKPLFELGHDDDGEKYAGKRVAKILEEESVEGAVVVARWYGGVMLGPVRFKWIEDCAREAIRRAKNDDNDDSDASVTHKRTKLEHQSTVLPELLDWRSKEELEKILMERDKSINVLRELLAEKRGEKKASPGRTQLPGPIYATMKIEVLRKLERARDRTLEFILAEIKKTEQGDERLNPANDDASGD